jgi:hypothetical protein
MATLNNHVNVWGTCLQILHRKGFRMRLELDADSDFEGTYVAEKDGLDFLADNPLELLGLVAIYEEVKPAAVPPYWWCVKGDGPDHSRLLNEAGEKREAREKELAAMRELDPGKWIEMIRDVLDNSGSDSDAAGQLGITTEVMRKFLEDPLLRHQEK